MLLVRVLIKTKHRSLSERIKGSANSCIYSSFCSIPISCGFPLVLQQVSILPPSDVISIKMLAFKLLPFVALATSVWGSPIDNVNGTSLEARAGRTYTGDGTLFFSPYILRHTGTNIDNHSDILQSGSRCLRTDQRSQRFHRCCVLQAF